MRRGPHFHTAFVQPILNNSGARIVYHARQDARFEFHDGELHALIHQGVQNREGDESRADHRDASTLAHAGRHGARLGKRPEAVHVFPIRAGYGGFHSRGASGDQEVVVFNLIAPLEDELAGGCVDSLGAGAEPRIHIQSGELGR